MKNRKHSIATAAVTVAASVAMVFGSAAPASAAGVGSYYDYGGGGAVTCPSFKVARIIFKATSSGYVSWFANGKTFWTKSTGYHYVTAPKGGYAPYEFRPYVGYVSSVYAYCV